MERDIIFASNATVLSLAHWTFSRR